MVPVHEIGEHHYRVFTLDQGGASCSRSTLNSLGSRVMLGDCPIDEDTGRLYDVRTLQNHLGAPSAQHLQRKVRCDASRQCSNGLPDWDKMVRV